MTRRLVLAHLTLVTLVLVALAVPLGYLYRSSEQQQAFRQLEREAEVLAAYIGAELDENDGQGAQQVAEESARRWRGQVELFDASGRLVFGTLPGHGGAGASPGTGNRIVEVDGVMMMSAVVSVEPGRTDVGSVRVSVPAASVLDHVYQFWALLAVACAAVLVVSAAVAVRLAAWITKPVRALEDAAGQLADESEPAAVLGVDGPPELRRLAQTFNRTASRLHSVLAARGAFVEHASHQLKSPLAALRLRLENLEPEVSAAGAPNLEAAIGETERLDKLVNTLLDLTMVEGAEQTPETVDLTARIVDRSEIWQPLAAERDVTVLADVPPKVLVVVTPGSVEQILDNLISNALAVAPDGSVIRLVARPSSEVVEVHVVDSGPGLPQEQRERALEPFWRAPGAPKGGSGLGLALVRKLAEADGGHVRLDPAEPSGIDAVVTLPAGAHQV
ncbi:sensor histidine kinase [Actinoplanes rectilineatus]|uniref:sensor histidine kinase n=1 Tax=Actinoplanes rectilineatus TaxID=113571 RepID=UPI0005F29F6E|nr:HAMP domain-containing sensor histidine kinase [Actinoplanes rectilineatus]